MSEPISNEVASFVLDQQAKQAVRMEQLTNKLEQLVDVNLKSEKRISELEGAMVAGINLVNNLYQKMGEMADYQKDLAKSQKELVEAQTKAEAQMAALRGQIEQTNARLDETNERLNIFINVLERYISENRNGKRPPNDQ